MPRALPPAARVLYAHTGDVAVLHDGASVTVQADSAWYGAGACAMRARDSAATVLRWELVRPETSRDGTPVLEQTIELADGAAWLIRCDRVDFDPGGMALPHRHRGGGIRCLIAGALEVTVGDAPARRVTPGGAWFESGREPVLAVASQDEDTSFIRVAILPREIRGRTSIMYVNPVDSERGRPRTYTIFVDEPIDIT